MLAIQLTREGYLERRLKAGRAQIAKDIGVPYSDLMKWLTKWGLKNLDEERDLLDRMRAIRGLPPIATKAPATTKTGSTEIATSPAEVVEATIESLRSAKEQTEPVRVLPPIVIKAKPAEEVDLLAGLSWLSPVTAPVAAPIRVSNDGVRVSGVLGEALQGADRVQVGFAKGLMVIRPSKEGWHVKKPGRRVSGYLIGTKRVRIAAEAAGFTIGDAVDGVWDERGYIVARPRGDVR